jgi:KRAB domain-containing zinc finger protein
MKNRLPCLEPGCNKTFKTERTRKEHQIVVHQGQKRVYCSECGISFATADKLIELREQHPRGDHQATQVKNFHCLEPACGKSFLTLKRRNYHYSSVHQGKYNVKCSECGKICLHKSELKKHLARGHGKPERHHCHVCKIVSTSTKKLEMHVQRQHERIQDFCDKCNINIRGLETLETHMLRHQNQPKMVCDHCNILFSSLDSLRVHLRSINGETPFRCDECNESYSSASALREHRTARHAALQNHVCDVDNCGKAYGRALNLRDHKASVHDKDGYICPVCQKKSRSIKTLNKHIRKHKGDTPYACTYPGCHLKFVQSHDLIKHCLNHTLFKCHSCQHYFDTAVERHKHKMTCPRYVCI